MFFVHFVCNTLTSLVCSSDVNLLINICNSLSF
uniref:Uncharacterized protein n=1 Tax=Anguilla anguilla TaxID=7936 RepID=A0A0E9PIS6_ANGAN